VPTEPDARGAYTLVVELAERADTEVGALGVRSLEAGWYAYTGSAHGAGGFARVDRHLELAAGERSTRHWHVDYLLGNDATEVDLAVCSAGVDAECAVARAVDGQPVLGFGCSDCDCPTHLQYSPRRAPLLASVAGAHRSVRAPPHGRERVLSRPGEG
jgi:endonuclease-3